jgi:hypothetical protein
MTVEEEKSSPRALTHMSTGVVYASPGVVKIPPCVLDRIESERPTWHDVYTVKIKIRKMRVGPNSPTLCARPPRVLVVHEDTCHVQHKPRQRNHEVLLDKHIR